MADAKNDDLSDLTALGARITEAAMKGGATVAECVVRRGAARPKLLR